MKKPTGYVIYDGPSNINGEPIIAIVTMKSVNEKTGDMVNMWIMHKDVRPTEAAKTGQDASVCGDCDLRHFNNGACYVVLHQAPLNVWKSFHRGNYPELPSYDLLEGMEVRFGSYGDPYAIPYDILNNIKSKCKNNTGYTHQWKNDDAKEMMATNMASADSIEDAKLAHSKGYRTFRVTHDIEDLLPNEIVCPFYTHGVKCKTCNLCSGNASKAKSIVAPVHGSKKKKFNE
jgi:hypothetical protein